MDLVLEQHQRLSRHRKDRPLPTSSHNSAVPEEVKDALAIARDCLKASAYEQAIVLLHITIDKLAEMDEQTGRSLPTREAAECAYLLGTACRHELYLEKALHAFVLCATIRENLFGADDPSSQDARLNATSVFRHLFPSLFSKLSLEEAPTLAEILLMIRNLEEKYLLGVKMDEPQLVADALLAGLDLHYQYKPGHSHPAAILDNYRQLVLRTDLAESPLLFAVRSGAERVVSFLLNTAQAAGAGHIANHFELNGISPLIVAAGSGHSNIVFVLCETGKADPSLKSARDGSNALHACCMQGDFAIAELLIGFGADPNEPNAAGETPLMIAAMNGHLPLVGKLIDNKADVNAAKPDGVTALFFAAQTNRVEICQLLLHRGAHPNDQRNTDELSVLQIAAAHGNAEVCELLITHGSRAYHRARDGKTAADIAQERGHAELATVLHTLEKVQ